MEIAMVALRPALSKLGDLLVGEFTLEKRVRKGIESLVRELTLMHAALRKVAKVPPDQLDEGVKIWAGNVRDLSYQMEDIVDAFMVRVEGAAEPANPKNKVKKLLKKTIKLFKKGRDLHHLSDALEEAVGQAKQLAELRQRYEQEMGNTNAGASVDPRLMAMYRDVKELVGIEETRDELINMLTEGDDWVKHPLKTVSIVGFGGLGKTTLAKAVYDKIKVQFDCGAFISVSQSPDTKKLLKDILFELDKNKYENIYNVEREEKHLIDELIEFLNNKRYLIVVDDIWDTNVWELIKCAFFKDSIGSRLITTTRILTVSEACCSSSDDIYRMKPLSNDVSRRLFYKRVFSQEKVCPPELVNVCEDILKKCGGIPLAIITIASLLASNYMTKTKDQWFDLLNSIGRGLTEHRSLEQMKKILLLSYYDLPFHLKPCLLYLSMYPEDYRIMRDDLILRWIAEGFVYHEKQKSSLFELGVCYFNELVNRNMIQLVVIGVEEYGEKACRVHDMVLDLIRSLSSKENFVTILDSTGSKVPSAQNKVHRLSIQNTRNVDLATTNMAQVRSVAVFGNGTGQMPLVKGCKVLRVLALEDSSISDIGYVDNMLHLRYIRLKHTKVQELPVDIGNLHFLQTLDLKDSTIVKLPSSIVLLRNLTCLRINEYIQLPSGMDCLTSLEVLEALRVGHMPDCFNLDMVKELCHLNKLRVLKLILICLDESMQKDFMKSLSNLHKLESLYINGTHIRFDFMQEGWVPPPQLRSLNLNGEFKSLPSWISLSLFPLLSFLSIKVYNVRPEDIRLLGMLPTLRVVDFQRINFMKTIKSKDDALEMLDTTVGAFPCATRLWFLSVPVIPSTFPRGAAPRLKNVWFGSPAMSIARGDFDLGMGHLPSLETVQFSIWPKGSSDSVVDEAEVAVRAAARDHPNSLDLSIRKL
ncbi:disease resistance protein RGA5-like [Lolium rigidum]|uniref:disease resistance protein RGA5-like n=1 Tax=Lolium rigidum TaxID=89674 RepID=UPI001F5CF1AA|nr:disease resistance protein RGA5-like [Lolium rigidum]